MANMAFSKSEQSFCVLDYVRDKKMTLMRWPPRSPDLTACDFFLWGFVKDTVFVPPLPANLQDLCNRITAAVALVDRDMLTRVERDGLSHRCLPYYQRWIH